MTKTEHYQLNQWDPSDQVKRTDFNEDNARIEQALAGLESSKADSADLDALQTDLDAKADTDDVDSQLSAVNSRLSSLEGRVEVRAGSYVGDGAASKTISLGFTPKAVLVENIEGARTVSSVVYGGLALPNLPVGLSRTSAEIVSGGFKVYENSSAALNYSGAYYCYLAFK